MLYNFAENLKRLRKERKMTTRELGIAVNVDYTTICRWENCERYPTLDKVHDLAKVLGVGLHDLLDEDAVY